MKRAFVFLADGFEELEAIAPIDILMRGGLDVKVVSLNPSFISTGAHGLPITCKMTLNEFKSYRLTADDVMVFPGGMPGAANLAACAPVTDALAGHASNGGLVAAICAAPAVVLASCLPDEALKGRSLTCYDGFETAIEATGAIVSREGVVFAPASGNWGPIVTAKGPGFAVPFALEILARATNSGNAGAVASAMML